ncbi:MAG: helix-turn-helix domain-containing protein [Verrucomicrobiota bacterium]
MRRGLAGGPAPRLYTDRLFHALADGTRRDIVAIALHEEQSVSQLARRFPMSFAAVQKHVAVLERAGLVTKERRGRVQLVRGNGDAIRRAHHLLDRLEVVWRERIDRVGHVLSTPPKGDPDELTGVEKNAEALTMTVTAEFDAPVAQVWEVFADPRKLERWWGQCRRRPRGCRWRRARTAARP